MPTRSSVPAERHTADTETMSTILDGKAVAQAVRAEAARAVEALRARGILPGLATVLVGDDPASRVYVGSKERACTEIGMQSVGQRLPAETRRRSVAPQQEEHPRTMIGCRCQSRW